MGTGLDAPLALVLGAALVAITLLTTGGIELGPNTWLEIALTVLACGLVAAVVLVGGRGPAWGGVTVLLFCALAALTFASIAWSVKPDTAWVEANRTLSYLAAFAGAMALARLAPGRWPALVGAIAIAATAICCYALLTKVFPAAFDPGETVGRLRAPYDYYNATGLIAAVGIAPCLWVGARREGGRALRVLSVPAIAVLVVVLALSYSRGAVLAAIVGLCCWFAIAPLRLRSVLLLAPALAGGGLMAAWALGEHSIAGDQVALHLRTAAGHTLGLLLLAMLIVVTVLGSAGAIAIERVVLAPRARRRVGAVLVVLLALVPAAGVLALAASSRGLTGEVSHLWEQATNPKSVVFNNPSRLGELGSSRPRYWRDGLKVGEHALLAGVGARGYATARSRYVADGAHPDAHSYLIETFADFGLIGVALTLALLIAWGLTAWRALAVGAAEQQGASIERAGLTALLAVAVTFGVHSALDWTWFIPGVALPGLLCAGWLAGRGPLSAPIGRSGRASRSPGRAAAVIALSAATLVAAWVIWQPLRSAEADASAVGALARGDAQSAVADARTAVASDPVSTFALVLLSEIYGDLGESNAAHRELVKATEVQPSNPQTWELLGDYDLTHRRGREAVDALGMALKLEPGSTAIAQSMEAARALTAHG